MGLNDGANSVGYFFSLCFVFLVIYCYWSAKKSDRKCIAIEKAIQGNGFKIDRFIYEKTGINGFLAIDATAKKVAMGKSATDMKMFLFEEIVSYRIVCKSKHSVYVEVVTTDIMQPTYLVAFMNEAGAQECFDVLQAALFAAAKP